MLSTHTYLCKHACKRAHTHVHAHHTGTHVHTHHTGTCVHTHSHNAHAHTHACTDTRTHTQIGMYKHIRDGDERAGGKDVNSSWEELLKEKKKCVGFEMRLKRCSVANLVGRKRGDSCLLQLGSLDFEPTSCSLPI